MYFAKLGILVKLAHIGNGLIPLSVYEEVVVEGKKQGKEDAVLVEKLVSDNVFRLVAVKSKQAVAVLLGNPKLSYADAEVLAVAKELSAAAIIDESSSRAMASWPEGGETGFPLGSRIGCPLKSFNEPSSPSTATRSFQR